jgi:DNA (cytosine-5)-methyltransferase 1
MLGDASQAHATSVSPDNVVSLEPRFETENPWVKPRSRATGPTETTGPTGPTGPTETYETNELTCLEICAGGGGQSLGLEQAGFEHVAALEIDPYACQTLRGNRPAWNVVEHDIHEFEGTEFKGVDLLAGGVPCPPFSIAGKQLGADDERDLFPPALRLVQECAPAAIMLENVRGLSTARFAGYREQVLERLHGLDYETDWQVLNACNFGVPQLRPRFILVAMRPAAFRCFEWPHAVKTPPTVGEALVDYMAADGWPGAAEWARKAGGIGPTLVGGSRKHGGPDLGPTRARNEWLRLHVDGRGLADAPPRRTDPVDHLPRLTLPMAAALQGFPASWRFSGRKTAAYRQIGNAFPPPVARAVGENIRAALLMARQAAESERLLRAV